MLNMSVANACIRGSLFDLDENHPIPGNADAVAGRNSTRPVVQSPAILPSSQRQFPA